MITQKLDKITQDYNHFFESNGYIKEQDVKITSKVDPSVNYIGSAISVLKPILLNQKIDSTGNYLIQRAIRTRALKNIYVEEKCEWSSFFKSAGVLVNYSNLEKLVNDAIRLLHDAYNISYKDIMIRISSKDIDLIDSLKNIDDNIIIEFDSRDDSYYKHKYGLQELGIYGRNFNIAINDGLDYKDIGNIIVIESDTKKYGVEFAIGLNSILMRLDGIKTSLEASLVADVIEINEQNFKFADCLSVVSNLAYENISKVKGRSQTYLYRKYFKALLYWQKVLKISEEQLLSMIKQYIILEYNEYFDKIIEDNVLTLIRK